MKFESKIAAPLDTHSLFAWDAGTNQLIGCKWVMETLDLIMRIIETEQKEEDESPRVLRMR